MADLGSRKNRSDDYGLAPLCLSKLLANSPKVTVDAMASSSNAICSKFFSKYSSLNSQGVVSSQFLDQHEFYLVFPPVSMAVSTLRFFEGIFIIPLWPTSSWFNTIFEDGAHCSQWVQKLLKIEQDFSV